MQSQGVQTWPKTADGTTDWETVFEDSQSGLINAVAQANSLSALHECGRLVISSLFTRKSDHPEIQRFMAALDATVADGRATDDVEATRTQVIYLLRQIKNERIKKARLYLAEKRRGQALERRSAALSPFERVMNAVFGTKVGIAGVAATLMIAVGAATAAGLNFWEQTTVASSTAEESEPGPNLPADSEPEPESAELGAADLPEPPALTEPEPEKPKEQYPQAVLLKPFYWSYRTKAGKQRYITYQPFVMVPSEKKYRTICVNAPWVTDAIVTMLSAHHPQNHKATQRDLAKVSRSSTRRINARHGDGTVSKVELVTSQDDRFRDDVLHCELEIGGQELANRIRRKVSVY